MTTTRARHRGNGEGTVTRDGPRWVGRITVGTKDTGRVDAEGRPVVAQVRRKFTGATRAEVVRRMEEARRALRLGLPVADDRLTVGTWMAAWLERLPGEVSPATVDAYRSRAKLVTDHLGQVPLTRLTPSAVSDWLRALDAAGYAPATRRAARAVLVRALRVAEQDGLVARNAAAIADGPKGVRSEGRSLTGDEAAALLAAAAAPKLVAVDRPGPRPHPERHAAALVVALGLGLRRGEVLGLRWVDVDLDTTPPVVAITGQLTRHRGAGLVRTATKTKRDRTLALPAFVADALRSHRAAQAVERLAAGSTWAATGYVFTTPFGTPVDPRNFNRLVADVAGRAGLGHRHPHELRHSAASLLLAAGVPLEAVADTLGHSSIRVTKDVYGHLLPGQRAEVANAMDRALGGA